ncbi:MAG TPA: cobyric acid synthase [Stellaceae bacterium]|nr:cobyric acid synthase [Stellaceae bacterium]
MRKPALMLQGTGSDVGKSVIVAGLARAFTQRGLRVMPFKPQNMSNNAAVTSDGGEIGRAQALQARAARVAPRVDMNPVLLKPQAGRGAQVIVGGKTRGAMSAQEYQIEKISLLPRVLESFARLEAEADLVLVEGAGSPAEVNLRAFDIANMGFALAAQVPVALIGDIDRGGVIAQLVGTHELLAPDERALVKGYIVNKFRGDLGLFADAIDILRPRLGVRCFGILPWLDAIRDLPAEDSMALRQPHAMPRDGALTLAVPLLPHIANFDDLDPLRAEPGVAIELVPPGRPLPLCDLVLLPGSKATLADLAALRREGWDIDIRAHARRGGHVLGICAGYQMLGRRVSDPSGIEGAPGEAEGLGLLDIATEMTGEKLLTEAHGIEVASGAAVAGYEMHIGRSRGPDAERPMLRLGEHKGASRDDGARSHDGRIMGCHLHGLFASDAFRRAFLTKLGAAPDFDLIDDQRIEHALDALARHIDLHVDLDALLQVAHAR